MLHLLKERFIKYSLPLKIWLIYSLLVTSIPFIFYILGFVYNLPFSYRTYLIDFWGYFWDGSHYIYIAQYGYKFPLQAFFPGYPLLLKFIDTFLPISVAYRINYLIVLLLVVSLYKFLDLFNFTKEEKVKSLILYLCYPTSFFLIANYTEALYSLLATWILIFLSQNKFKNASLTSFLISTIKISSVIFPLLLTLRFLKANLNKLSIIKLIELGVLNLTSVLGIILYFLYLEVFQKGYKVYFKAQAEWGRGSFSFISDYIGLQSEFYFERISEILVFILLIGVFIWAYKKVTSEIYIFSIYHFLLPVLTGTLLSLNRLSLYCFPVLLYFFGKISKNKLFYYVLMIGMLTWQLIGIYVFINGNFVG